MDGGESNVDDNDDDGDKNHNNNGDDDDDDDDGGDDDDDVGTPPATSCLPAGRTNGRGISKRALKVKSNCLV